MALLSESTSFTLDNMGRFLCNTLQEAKESARQSVAGRARDFDVIIVGGGTGRSSRNICSLLIRRAAGAF
jgi:molybdopterin biosynthesis enzyme MoaB